MLNEIIYKIALIPSPSLLDWFVGCGGGGSGDCNGLTRRERLGQLITGVQSGRT